MRVLRTALGSAPLRRLLLGFAASSVGMWAFTILFALYAYAEGGATAVGVAALVRMLPCAFAAPSLAVLADRYSRRAVLLASTACQTAALVLVAAAIALDAAFAIVLVLGGLFTIASAPYRLAQGALIPRLADSPGEIAAANVALSGVDYAGFLVGSLLTGVLATTLGIDVSIAICGLPYLVCIFALTGLPHDERPEPLDSAERTHALAEIAAGVRTIWGHPEMRLVNGIYALDMLVQGMIDVLIVLTAIEMLDLGESGVGWLNSAWGVGGLAGGLVALGLLGRGRLASGVAVGCVLAGLSLTLAGLVREPTAAIAVFIALGVGFALLESALLTLTQRAAPDDVLARVFGVQETLLVLGSALGGVLAAVLVEAAGLSAALVATGLVLPVTALILRASLARLEAGVPVPQMPFARLRGLAMFSPLPVATIETLATRARVEEFPAGTEIVRQGDAGDRFYVIDDGSLTVVADGRQLALREPGECFGEIALLRDQPRMATVRSVTPVRLVVLDRDDFLGGVSAHVRSTHAAERLAAERLEESPAAT